MDGSQWKALQSSCSLLLNGGEKSARVQLAEQPARPRFVLAHVEPALFWAALTGGSVRGRTKYNKESTGLLQASDLEPLHEQNDTFVILKSPGSVFSRKTFLVYERVSRVHSSGADLQQVLSEIRCRFYLGPPTWSPNMMWSVWRDLRRTHLVWKVIFVVLNWWSVVSENWMKVQLMELV